MQEILTIKSDDTSGRVKSYESIVKGEGLPNAEVPESFKVLIKEMKSLALNVELRGEPKDTAKDEEQAVEDAILEGLEKDAQEEEIDLSKELENIEASLDLEDLDIADDKEQEKGDK